MIGGETGTWLERPCRHVNTMYYIEDHVHGRKYYLEPPPPPNSACLLIVVFVSTGVGFYSPSGRPPIRVSSCLG